MTVYFVGHIKIKNREAYDRYSAAFPAIFAKFKGKVLAADFDAMPLVGDWDADRMVILSFPSKPDLMAWLTSPEYQEIGADRDEGADVTAILANGLEG